MPSFVEIGPPVLEKKIFEGFLLRSYHVLAVPNTSSVGSYHVHARFLSCPPRFINFVLIDSFPQQNDPRSTLAIRSPSITRKLPRCTRSTG